MFLIQTLNLIYKNTSIFEFYEKVASKEVSIQLFSFSRVFCSTTKMDGSEIMKIQIYVNFRYGRSSLISDIESGVGECGYS